jgi:hypothetical protein
MKKQHWGREVLRTASDECRRQRMSVLSIGSNLKIFFINTLYLRRGSIRQLISEKIFLITLDQTASCEARKPTY